MHPLRNRPEAALDPGLLGRQVMELIAMGLPEAMDQFCMSLHLDWKTCRLEVDECSKYLFRMSMTA